MTDVPAMPSHSPGNSVSAYDTLDVDFNCSVDCLKASYKRLILIHHPDKSGGDSELFQKIQSAWNLVSSSEKRKMYDMTMNSGALRCSEDLTIDEFRVTDDGDSFVRSCRCGDFFEVK